MITQYFQDLKLEFKNYSGKKFMQDAMAGLTVTAVALPLALAFGVSSGADAASGLITAIIAGLLIGGLSGASYQVTGPTGAMSAILISLSVKYGIDGVFTAGFISGIILLIAAVFHFGRVVSYIPSPVITGFTSGIAVIIALGQVDNFFGTVSKGENAIEKIISYSELGFSPNIYAIAFGLLVIAVMVLWPKKLNAKFPSSLAGIIIALAVNLVLDLPVAVVGEIPRTLFPENRLSLGVLTLNEMASMLKPAVSIAMLGMIESLLCGASAGKMKNERLNADRELIAQGIGNVLIPFFGGVPATAAIARTSVAIKSGGQTRLVSIVHALGLLLSMFLLGSVMSKIPLSALAGVLMVTAWRMNEWHEIKYIFDKRFMLSIAEFSITMAATVLFDLTIAILLGVTSAILLFVLKNNDLNIEVSYVDMKRVKGKELSADHTYTKIVYMTGPLYFITKDKLNIAIEETKDAKTVIFSMRAVTAIDSNGLSSLKEMMECYIKRDVKVLFCGVQKNVKSLFDRSGLTDKIGNENFYWDAIEAMESLEEKTKALS